MSQKSIKMLSIDDRMLTTDLDRAGYRNMGIIVKQVSSFADAQDLVGEDSVDIIVINMDYNKIDALAITQHFKSQRDTSDIPIVLTSVQTNAGVKKSALGAGANLFVEQPLPRQYFVEKLKKLLDKVTRSNDRVDVGETVSVTFDGTTHELPIGDISSSGMLVATEIEIPEGTDVRLSFSLPGYRKPIQVAGQVVRRIRGDAGNAATKVTGIGVRFGEFDGDSDKRLERYISKTNDKDGKMIYYL